METPHVLVRLMGSGLEVNLLVKVRIRICSYTLRLVCVCVCVREISQGFTVILYTHVLPCINHKVHVHVVKVTFHRYSAQ